MLDLVEISLADSGLEYRRLDGGMSSRERERCVAEFRADPTVRVFLVRGRAPPSRLALGLCLCCSQLADRCLETVTVTDNREMH